MCRALRVVVLTRGPGGDLPPMPAAASILDRRGHEVRMLASGETLAAARQRALAVAGARVRF
jgi:hypothetical protein